MIEISFDFEKLWIKNTRRPEEGAGMEEKSKNRWRRKAVSTNVHGKQQRNTENIYSFIIELWRFDGGGGGEDGWDGWGESVQQVRRLMSLTKIRAIFNLIWTFVKFPRTRVSRRRPLSPLHPRNTAATRSSLLIILTSLDPFLTPFPADYSPGFISLSRWSSTGRRRRQRLQFVYEYGPGVDKFRLRHIQFGSDK